MMVGWMNVFRLARGRSAFPARAVCNLPTIFSFGKRNNQQVNNKILIIANGIGHVGHWHAGTHLMNASEQ